MPKTDSPKAHLLAATLACLIWSGSIIASKISYSSIGPMSLGLIRFGTSALLLLAVLKIVGKPDPKTTRRDIFYLIVTGVVGTTFYFAAENFGALLLPASTSSLIVGAFPAMTLVMETACDRVRPPASKVFGIALAFIGVAILAIQESSQGGKDIVIGSIALLFGGACWGAYNLMMRPLIATGHTTLWITSWQTVFGALGFIPLAALEGLPNSLPDVSSIWSLIYLVVACTVLGFVLYNWGLSGLSPSVATSLANLIPVFGLIFSALILHEEIHLLQLVGGATVVCGIFFSTRSTT